MILADKIIQLRKKNGWSQEELANQLNVSRQAVSKWESAQAAPDLNKILAMSQLFGVTTDYLLKDEMEAEEAAPESGGQPLRRVTLADAAAFIAWREKAALIIAGALLLCILGAAVMLAVTAAGSLTSLGISEEAAGALGVGALLLFAAAAVILFIYCGHRNAPYEFLDREDFETDYGVDGLAQKKRREGQKKHTLLMCAGVGLCVLSPVPVIMGAFFGSDLTRVLLVCVTLLLAGAGAALCTVAGVRRAALDKLLRQGDYSAEEKRISRVTGPVSTAFWLLATASYLAWSFLGGAWNVSWVLWPVAGVLYAAVIALCRALAGRKAL